MVYPEYRGWLRRGGVGGLEEHLQEREEPHELIINKIR